MRASLFWRLAGPLCVLLPATSLVAVSAARGQEAEDEEEMTFEPEDVPEEKVDKTATPPPDTKPPSKTLARAVEMYDKGKDYYSASIELGKVVNGQTGDSPANKQRGEFYLARTLYKLGFYAASLAYFDKIVGAGTGHRFYPVSLKWLAALSRALPETSGVLEKIGTYDVADLEQSALSEVRDELYYLLGRHFYRRGEFDQAVSLFQSTGPESPFFIKAKFFQGVTHVRKYEGKPAVDAFKEILVVGEERPQHYSPDEIDEYVDLANLSLARVFYSTQQYDLSIKYYEKLPQESPDWLASLFEASYAYFRKTINSKALGNIHTLQAPFFEDEFFSGMAEGLLLQAVIYYKYCQYERALEAVAEYNQRYRPLRDQLRSLLGKYEDHAEFYNYARQIMSGKSGLDEEVERVAASALADRTLAKTFAWVGELEKELEMHGEADPSWQNTRVASEVLQELTVQQSLAMADAGRLARERLKRLEGELREISRDGARIKYEILNQQAGKVEAEARGEQIAAGDKPEPIVIDDEHFMWKFNGEWWKDELGFYRFRIRSKCPAGAGN